MKLFQKVRKLGKQNCGTALNLQKQVQQFKIQLFSFIQLKITILKMQDKDNIINH